MKTNELSGLKSQISSNDIDILRLLFKGEITRAYEIGVHDAFNFSINKDDKDELEIYKNKYFEETFIDDYLLSEKEISQCVNIKNLVEFKK